MSKSMYFFEHGVHINAHKPELKITWRFLGATRDLTARWQVEGATRDLTARWQVEGGLEPLPATRGRYRPLESGVGPECGSRGLRAKEKSWPNGQDFFLCPQSDSNRH